MLMKFWRDITPVTATVPIPWSIVALVAFWDVHESVLSPPIGTTEGFADSVQLGAAGGGGGGGAWPTVTEVSH